MRISWACAPSLFFFHAGGKVSSGRSVLCDGTKVVPTTVLTNNCTNNDSANGLCTAKQVQCDQALLPSFLPKMRLSRSPPSPLSLQRTRIERCPGICAAGDFADQKNGFGNFTTETCGWRRLHGDRRRSSAYVRQSQNTVGDRSAPRTCLCSVAFIAFPRTKHECWMCRVRSVRVGRLGWAEWVGSGGSDVHQLDLRNFAFFSCG